MRESWLDRLKTPEPQQAAAEASEIAIRLADEGVPLACIARAMKVPSNELRERLEAAREAGRLIELPRNDWPPYDTKPRRVVAEDRGQQTVALQVIFGATRTEAGLLLDLLKAESICKGRYASKGAVDVHILHLRQRLAPLSIRIVSIHGHGYRLSSEDRRRLMRMVDEARSAG
jgi:hypothetical protein